MKNNRQYPRQPKDFICKSHKFLSTPHAMNALQHNALNVILAFVELNTPLKYVEIPLKQLAELCLKRNIPTFREELLSRHFEYKKQYIKPTYIDQVPITFFDLFNPIEIYQKNKIARFYFTPLAMESFVNLPEEDLPEMFPNWSILSPEVRHSLNL